MRSSPCVIVVHPYPDLYGSDRALLESVAALTHDWRVIVVLPFHGRLAEEVQALGPEVRFLSFPVLRKALLRPSELLRLLVDTLTALPRLVRLLRRERAQALYVNTLTEPVWLVAATVARVPAVCHVHEAEDELPLPLRLALYLPLLLASTVLVNSRESARTAIRAVPALRRRTEVVYNGLERPMPVGPPRPQPLTPARLVLVGRLSPRKGTDVAVEAVRLLHSEGLPVHLTLVGGVFPGYEDFAEQVRKSITSARLQDAVDFAGFQPDVWSWYDDADIVIVPSRQEPFGNVAVEGMLCRRPVVAARVQGLAEIIEDGRTGLLVPVGDASALADALARLLRDDAKRMELARAGEQAAILRFGRARYRDAIATTVASLTGFSSKCRPDAEHAESFGPVAYRGRSDTPTGGPS